MDKDLIAQFWSANGPENGRKSRPKWSSRRMPRDRLSKLRSRIHDLGGDYKLMEAAADAIRLPQDAVANNNNNMGNNLLPAPGAVTASSALGPAAAAAYPQQPVQSRLSGAILDPALMQVGSRGGLGSGSVSVSDLGLTATPAVANTVYGGNGTGFYMTDDRLAHLLRGELNDNANNNLWAGVQAEYQRQSQLPPQPQLPPIPESGTSDAAMITEEPEFNNHNVRGADTVPSDSNAPPVVEGDGSAAPQPNEAEIKTESAEEEPAWNLMTMDQINLQGFKFP